MDDSLIQDWDEESSFGFEGAYTSTPLRIVKRTTAQFPFESEEKDAGVANETCDLSDHFEYHSIEDAFDTAMYDIVANDSVELTKKRLPSRVA
ncbi:hypothetical protein M378DRAFT_166429 [Amanita muscaria Koide BX008]|uniref:Uncharacterized protein n=1 Tax=Amanita muscaria (strain Koide BX008) TaxID=946122 RepID=A0A0C2T5E8_AMAMK|nr:hypothetical protein M378DRAFT_166429 [Amanita muscaria Koide BX008]